MHLVASTVVLVGNEWDSDAEAINAAGKAPSDLAAKPIAPCFGIVDAGRYASGPESMHCRTSDAPDGITNVIRHQQRALLVDRDADGPPHRVSVLPDEASQHIDRFSICFPCSKGTKITL